MWTNTCIHVSKYILVQQQSIFQYSILFNLSQYQQYLRESHSVSKVRRILNRNSSTVRAWNCWRKKKKRKYLGGPGTCSPGKFLKVETKICAICGILEENLKKSSSLKFILIFKKVCLSIFFPWKIFCSAIFDFHFRENPCFRVEFLGLNYLLYQKCQKSK